MSSPLSNIHFWKIDNKTCKIECSLASQFSQTGYIHEENLPSTALVMLCELIDRSSTKVNSKLLELLENDLNITEESKTNKNEYVSNYFIPPSIAMKYIEKCEQIEKNQELLFVDTIESLNLPTEREDAFWADIFKNAEHDFYKPTRKEVEDLWGEEEREEIEYFLKQPHGYFGNMNFLQNWEILEKHLTPKEINKIHPRQVFKITFKEDYLADIEDLESHQSCLDANISHWLEEKKF
ncbi:MAG: hypothetical protein MUC49_15255 [Raineya sp.]|jgi:hypothetical protein|nr:hypothetical protein [Raineya sp.]